MIERAFNFFASLKLTVATLSLALVLVFAGTLAQVKLGLYVAQEEYFRSWFVWWGPEGASFKFPVLPGGWLLGTVLLVNLIAAHFKRFQFSRKKIGIFLIHGGLILLLLGQFFTEVLQVESNMRLEEGETKNYVENTRLHELVLINASHPEHDEVIAFPESVLDDKEIRHPQLPFTLRVKEFFPNSQPVMATSDRKKIQATEGIGRRLHFEPLPVTAKMDDENKPSALIEVVADSGSLGEWTVSTWLTKYPWLGVLRQELNSLFGSELLEPQQFTYEGKTYQIALRPIRYYRQHSITLLDFTHDRYSGTEIPKNFSSKVRLQNPETGEDREILIYMNNPLRYAGETYYQGSFERGDTVSILHVVRNPAWVTPYLSCTLMTAGLLTQFLMHLIAFSRKRREKAPAPSRMSASASERAETGRSA